MGWLPSFWFFLQGEESTGSLTVPKQSPVWGLPEIGVFQQDRERVAPTIPRSQFPVMTSIFKPLLVAGCLALPLSAPLRGQGDSVTERQRGWELKTFRTYAEGLTGTPWKKLPEATADVAVWDQTILECTRAWRDLVLAQGIEFGEEAKALYDPETHALSIYAKTGAVRNIEDYTEVPYYGVRHMSFTLEVLEGPSFIVRSLMAQAQPLQSHTAILREFEALVSRNEGKHVGNLRLETRSGQRSIMQAGPEQPFPSTFIRNEPGAVTALSESRSAGIKLTVDPVIGPDGWMMDLLYDLEVHHAPPHRREIAAPPLGDSQSHMLPVFDCGLAHITAAITYNGDDTKLLGVWTPCHANGQPRSDALRAAFLRMAPVSPERELNAQVEAKLREHLHRQGLTPTSHVEPELAVPAGKGLLRRNFKVPRSFLFDVELDMDAKKPRALVLREENRGFCFAPAPKAELLAPSDPFAGSDTGLSVAFPEGTEAHYHPGTQCLEVVHTEDGLRKIECLLDLVWARTPTLLAFSLHIVQAGGQTLRELAKDSATHADHTSIWGKVEELAREGKATVLSTQRFETRSGQRAKLSTGLERATVGAFEKTDRGTIEAKTGSKTIGATWEIDPVLSPDLRTIEMNLALDYHFAPLQPSPPDGKPTPDVGLDAEKTFAAKVQSAYTLQTGTTRLIGLWKPSGTPELDGKDVMQAAFLRADVVPVVDRENP
jgi:hypothetical protein